LNIYRADENVHYPFRSERFYHADNCWYFLIRGGNSKGPFDSRTEAQKGLHQYIETQKRLDQAFHKAVDSSH
jgi:hypothetical protein